jgi:ribosomal-protein-alanine N-acetyltransferase
MATPAVLTLRKAQHDDRGRLANLLHFETHVHQHLDWRRTLDWLGQQPFMLAENSGRLTAALACPPDPPAVAWLRLFAVSARTMPSEAWKMLWPAAQEMFNSETKQIVAIPLEKWFQELLNSSQFEHVHNVVVLDWQPDYASNDPKGEEAKGNIRPMRIDDLAEVHAVDNASFQPLWQHSLKTIQMAFAHCAHSTVIEFEGKIAAYQISSLSNQGLHLARLAVHPDWQGQHLAQTLVQHLQEEVRQMPTKRLTVNTQDINEPSLALYEKTSFQRTGEKFPVFEMDL